MKEIKKTDEYQNRLAKLENLKKLGINPYPDKFERTNTIAEAIKLPLGKEKNKVAGRIMTIRTMGKLTFANLVDESGKIQIALSENILGKDKYKLFIKNFDVGDLLGVEGKLFKTHKGELTLEVKNFEILAKSLRPLPEKWHGLKDQEIRYRKRYLDLIANSQVKELFKKRSGFIKNIRQYLENEKFLEVETPVLEQIPGGADAQPFLTHHNTLDIDLYLRISLELHLKRLAVGGFEKIFEIGRVFRNEGISTQHLQEFTLLEFYWAYQDYEILRKFIQDFYTTVIKKTFGTLKFYYQGEKLDFTAPWPKIDYTAIVKEKTKIDLNKCRSRESLITEIKTKKIKLEIDKSLGRGRIVDQLYKKYVRPEIIQPTFLINHPIDISPLAKKCQDNPNLTQRFQILVAGMEVGNAFSELNDPIDQAQRFEKQAKLRAAGDKEAQMYDKDFVEALEYGLPPVVGFGVGIDRLFMLLTNQPSIRDVIFFPMMRPEK